MCGIAGIYNLNGEPVPLAQIKRMCDVMRHRGPDDEGQYVDGGIGLGHRRLAIIDLSPAAHQPMANEDGSILIVYNGEIYNFPELVPILTAKGHRFHSKSDAEVVIHAYEEWGEDCIHKFNGIFAFAIWDSHQRKLFLARDRFGVKPLYYTIQNGQFIFASEIKAILEVDGVERRVCLEALNEYFTFQNVFSDKTLFEGIRILPAGHVMSVSEKGVETREYWDLVFNEDEIGEEECKRRIREVFERAVTRQLISDVPVGSYLSGGMDSGSLVAVASRHIPRLMTFTGGFDLSSVSGMELAFDEREDAEIVSSAFRTEHYEMVMHAGDMAWVLPKLVWHLEDLRVGMCYQNYYIARLASKFVKVLLGGTGGDEMFGGYPWRYDLIADCNDEDEFDRRYYRYWMRLVPDEEKRDFLSDEVWVEVRDRSPFESYKRVIERTKGLGSLNKAFYFEAKTFLHGLLVVEDKISMAHSLEVRVPFLDNELVDLALAIPAKFKYRNGNGKYILRQAMNGLLPESIVYKPKQGFSPPDESWYRGETMDYIKEILLDPRALNRGYFKPDYIRKVIAEHTEGRVNHRLLIWSLLCFEWWNRLFMDKETI